MKGALCKLQFAEGKFSSVDESDEGEEEKPPPAGGAAAAATSACTQEERSVAALSACSDSIDTGDVNANSTREGGGPTQSLCQSLSPDGLFAYCGLFTECLTLLFTEIPDDKSFAETTLKRFSRYSNSPDATVAVMEMRLRGEVDACPWRNYKAILKDDAILSKSFVPLVQDLVIFAVQGGITSGSYDARTRVLINHLSCQLCVGTDVVEMFEESVLEYLTEGQIDLPPEAIEQQNKKLRDARIKRFALISFASISGGALLALTGGLAAPFIGAGLGTMFGAGGTALATTTGIAVVGSLFGAAGAGLTGVKMSKRLGEVEEFSFDFLTEGSSLHITIAISGWLTNDSPEAFKRPWETLYNSREQYYLRYESKYLVELGKAMDLLLQFALSVAVQESLKYTILAGIISAVAWPTSLLTIAAAIDNPWGVCIRRSAETGRQLAQVLVQRHHGRRPVTLIGYSLGARVIYYCLQELAKKEGSSGIVQDAILLGAPVSGNSSKWEKMGTVVSGRIINGYCKTDWLLRFLYRTSSASIKIAGLQQIDWQSRKMFNFNLTEIVEGHNDYANKLDAILKTLGIRTQNPRRKEESDMKKSFSELQEKSPLVVDARCLRRCHSDSDCVLKTSNWRADVPLSRMDKGSSLSLSELRLKKP